MLNHPANKPEDSSEPRVSYREILSTLVKRFGRLAGMPAALNVARKVPQLSIDDDGNVLAYNISDPVGTITMLIDQYEVLYGEIARTLAMQATQTLGAGADEQLLQELGLSAAKSDPIRILLVDDHVLFREGLISLLNGQTDMEVVGQAGLVREAIALARKAQPHLVLMDLTLPDGVGFDAMQAILAEAPATKIVVLTVHEEGELLFQAIRGGAVGYFVKNVRSADLLESLRGVMRGEAAISGLTAQRILEEFARLSPPPTDQSEPEATQLTVREAEVLRELASGATNQEIAQHLVISENTVKNHVRNVLFKLHVHSRREAADYARRHGLTFRFPPP